MFSASAGDANGLNYWYVPHLGTTGFYSLWVSDDFRYGATVT